MSQGTKGLCQTSSQSPAGTQSLLPGVGGGEGRWQKPDTPQERTRGIEYWLFLWRGERA